jgi:hypothetical protein
MRQRSLQSSVFKREHPALQNMKILYFFPYGSFLLSWIRIHIRIQNIDPDPATQINADLCESVSTTLVLDPDSLNLDKNILLNPNPDPHVECGSGSGTRRAKMTHSRFEVLDVLF